MSDVPSPLVFFQLSTPDPEGAGEFYREVFGWNIGEPAANGVSSINAGGPGDFDVTGALRAVEASEPAACTPWFRVGDLWASFERAQELGAQVITPIRQQPGGLHFCMLRTPDGLAIGVVQA